LPILLRHIRHVSSVESSEFFVFLLDNQVFGEVKIAVFQIAGNCALIRAGIPYNQLG